MGTGKNGISNSMHCSIQCVLGRRPTSIRQVPGCSLKVCDNSRKYLLRVVSSVFMRMVCWSIATKSVRLPASSLQKLRALPVDATKLHQINHSETLQATMSGRLTEWKTSRIPSWPYLSIQNKPWAEVITLMCVISNEKHTGELNANKSTTTPTHCCFFLRPFSHRPKVNQQQNENLCNPVGHLLFLPGEIYLHVNLRQLKFDDDISFVRERWRRGWLSSSSADLERRSNVTIKRPMRLTIHMAATIFWVSWESNKKNTYRNPYVKCCPLIWRPKSK